MNVGKCNIVLNMNTRNWRRRKKRWKTILSRLSYVHVSFCLVVDIILTFQKYAEWKESTTIEHWTSLCIFLRIFPQRMQINIKFGGFAWRQQGSSSWATSCLSITNAKSTFGWLIIIIYAPLHKLQQFLAHSSFLSKLVTSIWVHRLVVEGTYISPVYVLFTSVTERKRIIIFILKIHGSLTHSNWEHILQKFVISH